MLRLKVMEDKTQRGLGYDQYLHFQVDKWRNIVIMNWLYMLKQQNKTKEIHFYKLFC